MALFTDGPVSSIEDLTARDSQLLGVASVEGIDVTQKIALAQDEIALELESLLTRLSSTGQAIWGWPEANLENVVVTLPLKLWHSLRCLELVYGDAYSSQLNDRYGGKRDQFRDLARRAYDKVVETGVGIASHPVPRAAAPDLSSVGGANGQLPDGTYFVTMGWVNGEGEEGACAIPVTVTVEVGTIAVQPGSPPQMAVGWNVYAGPGPDSMSRQNQRLLEVGEVWVQPAVVSTNGPAPGSGQRPSYVKAVPRILLRG